MSIIATGLEYWKIVFIEEIWMWPQEGDILVWFIKEKWQIFVIRSTAYENRSCCILFFFSHVKRGMGRPRTSIKGSYGE